MTYDKRDIEIVTGTYFEQVKLLADRVKPGMTRLQVEAIFPQSYGGIQGRGITIYPQARGAKVEVSFNNVGGPSSVHNEVIGKARVFIEIAGNRWGLERQK